MDSESVGNLKLPHAGAAPDGRMPEKHHFKPKGERL